MSSENWQSFNAKRLQPSALLSSAVSSSSYHCCVWRRIALHALSAQSESTSRARWRASNNGVNLVERGVCIAACPLRTKTRRSFRCVFAALIRRTKHVSSSISWHYLLVAGVNQRRRPAQSSICCFHLSCFWWSSMHLACRQGWGGVGTRGNGVPTPFCTGNVAWRFRFFILVSTRSAWRSINE